MFGLAFFGVSIANAEVTDTQENGSSYSSGLQKRESSVSGALANNAIDRGIAVAALNIFVYCSYESDGEPMVYILNEGANPVWFRGTLPVTLELGADHTPYVVYSEIDFSLSYNVFTRHYVMEQWDDRWPEDIRSCSVRKADLARILR